METPEDWLTDLMNAPDRQANLLQVQLITDDEQDETTMSSHTSEQENASSSVNQTSQQPVSRAVTTLSKKPPGACYQTLVTIEVGSEKKKFVIHKDILTFYSDFFRGAFNGSFMEATEGKLSLPDVEVEIFDIFNQFLYTGCLADGQGHALRSIRLIKLWLFGDRFIVPCLQNSAIDALGKRFSIKHSLPTSFTKLVWENTLPSAPLRKYMLDTVVHTADVEVILSSGHEEYWTHEALVDLAKALYNEQVVGDIEYAEQDPDSDFPTMPKRDKCYYHVHAEGEKCD
ncbi:hypothetical protein KCU61_g8214, partial [Aureobasidium melanogenum]